MYYNRTPVSERPVWSTAMAWFYDKLELCMHPEMGWDFGLWQDVMMTTKMSIIYDLLTYLHMYLLTYANSTVIIKLITIIARVVTIIKVIIIIIIVLIVIS